jgi:hypothetical protein
MLNYLRAGDLGLQEPDKKFRFLEPTSSTQEPSSNTHGVPNSHLAATLATPPLQPSTVSFGSAISEPAGAPSPSNFPISVAEAERLISQRVSAMKAAEQARQVFDSRAISDHSTTMPMRMRPLVDSSNVHPLRPESSDNVCPSIRDPDEF